jgi:hypothetical protein
LLRRACGKRFQTGRRLGWGFSGFFPKDFLQLFKAQARASTQISLDVKEL